MRYAIFKNLAVTFFLLALSSPALFAQATPIEPAKSFPDVPQLARSSAEVKQRYGPITNADGKPDHGDKLTQKVNQRLFRWHKDLSEQAAAQAMSSQGMMGPGAMGAGAGRMMGLLQTNAANLTAEFQKDQQAYGQARGQLDGQYKKKVNQIQAAYEKKEVQGGCYGSTPNYTINCKAVARQGNDAIFKAGDTYLKNLAPVYSDMRAKMKHLATQAQSVLDQSNKTFGGHPPFLARMMGQRLTIAAMIALAATNSAENDAVVLVYQESVKGPQVTF